MGRILIRRGGETIAAGKVCQPALQSVLTTFGRCCFGNQWLEEAGMSKGGHMCIILLLKGSQIPNVHVSAENTANMVVGNRRNSEKQKNKNKNVS